MYSHLVTIIKDVPALGIGLPHSFRTTADAVEMHRAACIARRERGNIVSFSIKELPLEAQGLGVDAFDASGARDRDDDGAAVNYPVGALVRSFDFPSRQDCYIEGRVESVDRDLYSIVVSRVVLEGRDVAGSAMIGRLVHPPVNGLRSLFGGVTCGVALAD